MTLLDDSGAQALSGFLFQLLGSSSQPVELLGSVDFEDDAGDARVSVTLEAFGQDAIVHAAAGQKAIAEVTQYKYSNRPDDHPIRPAELYDICTKLHKSLAAVADSTLQGRQAVLVTNRRLSPESQEQFDAAQGNTPLRSIDDVVEQKKGKKRINVGRTLEGNKRYRATLRGLDYRYRGHDNFVANLRRRAFLFGIQEHEIPEAVQRTAGGLVTCASGPPPRRVTLQKLDAWLTGDDSPVQLGDATNARKIRASLTRARAKIQTGDVKLQMQQC